MSRYVVSQNDWSLANKLADMTISRIDRMTFLCKRPNTCAKFVSEAFAVMAGNDEAVGTFLAASRPENPLYNVFYKRLHESLSAAERRLVLCNMERSRWCHGNYPQQHKKYVLVNVPSLYLVATDGDEHLSMRIALGSLKTKTPLLTSKIK